MTTRTELKHAYDNKLIDEIKYKEELFKLETTKKEKKPQRIYEHVTEKEYQALIKEIKNKKILLAFLLAYGCGLRVDEIISLQRDDIKFDQHLIFVRQGKGNKDRKVLIPKGFRKDYLSFFPLNITVTAIEKTFLKKSLKIGINRVIYTFKTKSGKIRNKYRLHFHCLRHSFAIRCLDSGMPANQVQILLGHASLQTTSRYTTVSSDVAIQNAIAKGL